MGALAAGMQGLLLSGMHLVLMMVMAPVCARVIAWCRQGLAGGGGPVAPLLRWRMIARIWGRSGMRAASGAGVTALAPWVALSMVLAAVLLVPSFSLGMMGEDGSDLLMVSGLLFAATALLHVVGLASGQGREGRMAAMLLVGMMLLVPALVMAVAVPWMATPGTTIAGLVRFMRMTQDSAGIRGPLALAGGAFILVGVDRVAAGGGRAFNVMMDNLAGPDRAVMLFARDLVTLAWITLGGDLLWPDAIVIPDATGSPRLFVGMMAAIALWGVRTLGLCGVVACLRTFVMASGQVARLRAGLALLCGCLAIVLLFAGREFG
ncbi:hypothetical protein F1645_06900 [Novacetimonas hansenii]|uniref:Formate hydrogenlyase subunit 4 n=2 Tax=Novacetimonas hansenii TaxID=436 RepID=A0AAW5ETI2_NOVHA|nr:hypothetical protein [Novacetimonas hansenii]EFG83627.1 hypothetical protein GXY_12608 [Novacetimonas hansenii ATCC 23769]MCJ8354441.1 hypothetical protein [Novacetimonas hansenii]GAN82857.1 hypothetical protein Gaha_0049_014 [Novacetimonas hansenii JCM 7643]GBQ62265.1 hypothetical protein AA0243_2854 [Novacetimonas hansenii NRIC 0243]GEC62614.1 hypothetical protein GHA01_04630 [Novacetimonas hansenii]